MTKDGWRVADSDMHIFEPPDLWQRYIAPEWKHAAPVGLTELRRDMQSRGRTFEQVREQYYQSVRPMHMRYVEPSKRYADVVLPEGGNNVIALDVVLTKATSMLGLQPRSQRPPPWR